MEDPWRTPPAQDSFESCVAVEMRGPNVVVRSTSGIDRAGTEGLAHLINAAVATELAVVIDPEQLRCSDAVVSEPVPVTDLRCRRHHGCRPVDVEVVGHGILRVAGESQWWTIDVAGGLFCRSGRQVDVRFLGRDDWVALRGVWITPTRLTAMAADDSLVTANRAHHGAQQDVLSVS